MAGPSHTEPATSAQDGDAKPAKKPGLCVLRPYRPHDEVAVKTIVSDAAMETVWDYFIAALFSELFIQLAFAAIAIGFVGLSIPLTWCVSLVPIAIGFIYVSIYAAHSVKAMELESDLSCISQVYLNGEDTGFWVAEVYDADQGTELSAHFNITKKVIYEFVTEAEVDSRAINLAEYKHRSVVGCIALLHNSAVSNTASNVKNAWLRRLAVKQEYRRRNIATNLLEFVISFTRQHQYKQIQLLITECHYHAREMYMKAGFTATMNTRHFFNVPQPTYIFTLAVNPTEDSKKLK